MLFKKNLDLLYKVKGSGMMKAGKLCVSAIFRPAPSVAKSGKYTYLHSGALCTLQSKTVKSEFYKIGKKQLNYSNNNNNSNNNKSNSNHPKKINITRIVMPHIHAFSLVLAQEAL